MVFEIVEDPKCDKQTQKQTLYLSLLCSAPVGQWQEIRLGEIIPVGKCSKTRVVKEMTLLCSLITDKLVECDYQSMAALDELADYTMHYWNGNIKNFHPPETLVDYNYSVMCLYDITLAKGADGSRIELHY